MLTHDLRINQKSNERRLMFLVDAHLDLAMNAVDWNRNLQQSVDDIRAQEISLGMNELGRGTGTLSFPELRAAGVGLCMTTMIARCEPSINDSFGHISPETCYAMAHAHAAYYRAMEQRGVMRMIRNKAQLHDHVTKYRAAPDTQPLGYVLTMEGADPLLTPDSIDEFHAMGLRCLGLTHYGTNRYGGGTRSHAGLSNGAIQLLKRCSELGISIDMTHLSDVAFEEMLEHFDGRIHASHQNSRRLSNWQRQYSDDQYRKVLARQGVIGIAFDIIMLQDGYVRGQSELRATIETAVQNIEIVCELAGNRNQVGLGTDLDGGYGNEQTPNDLRRYTDLPKRLVDGLSQRNYSDKEIDGILHGNWLRFFSEILPEA
jgi:membrane dipeptidase